MVAQLMHQVSGIPEYIKLLNRQGYSMEEETSRDLAFNKKLRFRPGSQWEYSNSNYLLLGAILEEVSDQPIPVFLQQLDLRSAAVGHDGNDPGARARELGVPVTTHDCP